MSDRRKLSHPIRLVSIIAAVTLWTILILARLVQLQIFQHPMFAQIALQRQQVTKAIIAPRGVIYDAHMDELATTMTVGTVIAEPRRIQDVDGTARTLASILELDPAELLGRMKSPSHQTFLVVQRRIDPEAEARIEALGRAGVYIIDENMRVYPNRQLASQTLGFVNMNGDGSAGLEMQYDNELKGTEGLISFDVDARRQSFRGKMEKATVQGHSLVLSIDKSIQYIADREIAAAVEKNRAKSGTAIVLESDTGRILALSVYPNFNCNTYNEYNADIWRNRAVSDLFEPGSTFKVVVAASALEAGLTRPQELIDCQMGSILIGGHVFHDHKPYGLLTFNQVLENSSNVGAAKLGLRLGEEHLYDALRKFGFGSRTGVDLPAEIIGLVRDWHQWSALSVGAISFGQEVGVTSLQILTAINAIANGGYLIKPSLVDRLIDHNGDLVRVHKPEKTQIISARTAAAVSDAFEGVVARGTGRRAALEGYRAAGKTGTAQKIENGRYSSTKYVASFIGFAPLPQPRLTILVQMDEPKGAIYGGDVSAPVFQQIMQEALLQLRIPPDKSIPLEKFNPSVAAAASQDYLPNATPVAPLVATGDKKQEEDPPEVISLPVAAGTIMVPDFRGMAKRSVLDRCLELGIRLQADGSGLAVFQVPPAGSRMLPGDVCNVTFAKGDYSARLRVSGIDARAAAQGASSGERSRPVRP